MRNVLKWASMAVLAWMLFDALTSPSLVGITTSSGQDAALILLIIFGSIALIIFVAGRAWVAWAAAKKVSSNKIHAAKFRFDVFLSYSSEDHDQAAALAEKLIRAGITVFFAGRQLEAGMPFGDEIRKALHESREIWLLATPHSIASTWVATEWGTAWALERKIVPILYNLNSTDLPDRLKVLHCVKHALVDAEIMNAAKRFKGSKSAAMLPGDVGHS